MYTFPSIMLSWSLMHHHNPQMIQMIQGNGQSTLHGWSTNWGAGCDLGSPDFNQRVWVGMAGFWAVKYPSLSQLKIWGSTWDSPQQPQQVIGNISFDDFDLDQQDLGGNLSWIEPSDLSQVACWKTMFFDGRKKKKCGNRRMINLASSCGKFPISNFQRLYLSETIQCEKSNDKMIKN